MIQDNKWEQNSKKDSQTSNQSPARKKYTKFGSSNIQKQCSIQRNNELFQRQESDQNQSIIASSYQRPKAQPLLMTKMKSQSSLSGIKSRGKLPLTPRKIDYSQKLSKKSQASSLKHILKQLKAVTNELANIMYQMQQKIKQTVLQISKQIEFQLTQYLQSWKKQYQSYFNGEGNKQKGNSQSLINEQKKLTNFFSSSNPMNNYQQNINGKLVDIERETSSNIISDKQHGQKVKTFSHMIHLRQRLRKQATNPIVKIKNNNQEGNQNIKVRFYNQPKRNSGQSSSSSKRNAAKSVQKLQSHLSSLKKLLGQ